MRTKEICCDSTLIPLRQGFHRGNVLGVYRRCFHVLLPDSRIVTVFGNVPKRVPLSICTAAEPGNPFGSVCLEDGMNVFFDQGIMTVPEAQFWCTLGGEPVEFLRRPLPLPGDLSGLELALIHRGKRNGAGEHLESWISFLHNGIPVPEEARVLAKLQELLETLEGSESEIQNALMHSVGLGIGLTPSADDMICGIAAAAWLFWPPELKNRFLRPLKDFVQIYGNGRTTAISCQQLLLTAQGRLSDPVYHLAQALSEGREKEIPHLAYDVMDYGSSSGTELCMGFLAGIQFVKMRGITNGEKELCHQE